MKENDRRACAGLLVRRERWSLTWRARLILLGLVVAVVLLVTRQALAFLAPCERVPADVLVIEGWVPSYAIKQTAREFTEGHYQRALFVRPIVDLDDKFESGQQEGDHRVLLLVEYGVPRERITALYPLVAKKDRTFHSALTVKDWMKQERPDAKSLNLITMGPHARRSRLLYEKAFGDKTEIGIIAMEDMEYDRDHWWRASGGVRDVLGEAIAYVYARFFFNPLQ